jgi:hypothetical protein
LKFWDFEIPSKKIGKIKNEKKWNSEKIQSFENDFPKKEN